MSIEELIEVLSRDGHISALYSAVDPGESEVEMHIGEKVDWRQTAPEILKQFPVQVI